MEITYIVFRQILKMFLMMGIGFGCYKIRFFTTKGSQVLSDTALFIVLPCVIFTSFQIEYDRQILYGIIVSFVLAAAAPYRCDGGRISFGSRRKTGTKDSGTVSRYIS